MENRAFKEMLNLNKISDPKFTQVDELLKDSEKSVAGIIIKDPMKGDEFKLDSNILEEFKRDRAIMFSNLKTVSSEDGLSEKKETKLFFSSLHDSSASSSEATTPTMTPKGDTTPKSSEKT